MTVNVETVIIAGLNSDPRVDLPVVADVPARRPARFVTVERTGGGPEDVRDLPIVTVHAWDESRHKASESAYVLADVIRDLAITHPAVGRVTIESIYNDPDVSGHPRYRVTAQVVTHDT